MWIISPSWVAMWLLRSDAVAVLKDTSPYQALTTISPAHRKAMARKLESKMEYFITAEFLPQNKTFK